MYYDKLYLQKSALIFRMVPSKVSIETFASWNSKSESLLTKVYFISITS